MDIYEILQRLKEDKNCLITLGFKHLIDVRAGRIFYNRDLDLLIANDLKSAERYGSLEFIDQKYKGYIKEGLDFEYMWIKNVSKSESFVSNYILNSKLAEECEYSVWVGGTEVNEMYLTLEKANHLKKYYECQGYDDVQICKKGESDPLIIPNENRNLGD